MTQKDVFQIISQIDQLTQTMRKLSTNKNQFTAFVGGTGQGKSTLVNVIHGVKLSYQKKHGGIYHIFPNQKKLNYVPKAQIGIKQQYYGSTYSNKFNYTYRTQIGNKRQSYRSSNQIKFNNTPKIQIGNKKQSCTRIPNVYDFNGLKSADLIGWFDTQNQKQQIINGFLNSEVLSKGKKIKIVMVNSIHTLQAQRGGNFVKMIKILHDMFEKDFTQICDSFLIVFSKINTQEWTQQGIYQQLNQIINFNNNLDEITKKFLKIIIQKKNIALFPTPDKIKQNHVQKIKYMINKLKYITLQNGSNISLSAPAIHLKNKLQNFVLENSYQIIEVYEKLIKKVYQSRTYYMSWQLSTPINNLNESLSKIQKIIECYSEPKTKKLCYQYEMMKVDRLYSQLNRLLGGKNNDLTNLTKNIKMIEFCQKINKKFNGLLKFLDSLSISIKLYVNQLQADRNTLQTQQQLKRIQRQHQQQRKRQQRQWQKWKENFERQQRKKLRKIQNERIKVKRQRQAIQRKNRQQIQSEQQQIQLQRKRNRQIQEKQKQSFQQLSALQLAILFPFLEPNKQTGCQLF